MTLTWDDQVKFRTLQAHDAQSWNGRNSVVAVTVTVTVIAIIVVIEGRGMVRSHVGHGLGSVAIQYFAGALSWPL